MKEFKNYNLSLYLKESQISEFEEYLKTDLLIRDDLSCKVYPHASILPTTDTLWPPKGGAKDLEDNWIYNSTAWGVEDETMVECYENCDIDIVYIGSLLNIYGHTFTDNLAKIWYVLFSPDYDSKIKIAYTAQWGPKGVPAYVREIFELLGLNIDDFIHIEKPTRFRNVYIPDKTMERDADCNYYKIHPIAKDIYRLIISNALIKCPVSANTPQKLYYTRTKFNATGWFANGLRDIGEKSLEKVFEKEGYTVISPEKYTISQQISLLQNCEDFVTTEGSISHNSIYLNPKARCIILRKVDWINKYQVALSQINDVPMIYIDVHNSFPVLKNERPYVGPFYMCITPYLEEFLGRKIFRVPLWIRPSWLFYYFIRSNERIISFFRLPFIQSLKKKLLGKAK